MEGNMHRKIIRAGLAAVGAALILALAPLAAAQSFPSRPVRIIVPYPPGGSADALIRPLAQRMSDKLGQPVVIENKPGANGVVGMEYVAKSPPDGYTIVLGAIGPLSVTGAMQKLPFDPVKDFLPITFVASVPNVLVVNSVSPVKSVPDLVALAKAKPGQLNYGSAGPGSSNQLAAELFNQAAGLTIVHVPYKGGAPAQVDLLGNQITLIFDNLPPSLPHIKSGSFRPLAVTSRARQPSLPDVPTMIELGYARFEAGSWFGLLAPAGTPADVVAQLARDAAVILAEPAVRERLQGQGLSAWDIQTTAFDAHIRDETARWAKVIKARNITME